MIVNGVVAGFGLGMFLDLSSTDACAFQHRLNLTVNGVFAGLATSVAFAFVAAGLYATVFYGYLLMHHF